MKYYDISNFMRYDIYEGFIINNQALVDLWHTNPSRIIQLYNYRKDFAGSYRFDEIIKWTTNKSLKVNKKYYSFLHHLELTEEEMMYISLKEGNNYDS